MNASQSLVAVILSVPFALHAASVSLPAVEDGGLRELSPNELTGGALTFRVGTVGPGNGGGTRTRGVVKFDVAGAVPAGAVITAVQLRVNVLKTTDSQSRRFQLRRLLVPWSESAVTWNNRSAPSGTWSVPGGSVGVDFSATVSGSTLLGNPPAPPPEVATPFTWSSTIALVADVQNWLNAQEANHGWMIIEENETVTSSARLLAARENADIGPSLEVTYTPPVRIESVSIQGLDFCLGFTAQAGSRYVVEWREDADTGAWTALPQLPRADTTGTVSVCDPLGTTRRFYRVGELPGAP